MAYTDGFVVPVPKDNLDAYCKMAADAGEIWRDHGALDFKECVGDDLEIEDMGTSFLEALGIADDETVMFSWILYESREHRDQVNAAVMADPRMKDMMAEGEPMPFDPSRMLYGGFKVLVDAMSSTRES